MFCEVCRSEWTPKVFRNFRSTGNGCWLFTACQCDPMLFKEAARVLHSGVYEGGKWSVDWGGVGVPPGVPRGAVRHAMEEAAKLKPKPGQVDLFF